MLLLTCIQIGGLISSPSDPISYNMPYDCQTTPGVPPLTLLNACMGILPCLHCTPPCHLIPPTQVMPADPTRRGQPKVSPFLAQSPMPGGEDRVQSVVI